MGRRAKNLLILGTLGLLAALAALGLWWTLHRAAGELGAQVGPGEGYQGLEQDGAADAPGDARAGGGIRLRAER